MARARSIDLRVARRAAAWQAFACRAAIAIAVVFALPLANVHTSLAAPACCCPNPASCKCPKHGPNTPCSFNRCHRDGPKAVSAELTVSVPQRSAAVAAPMLPAIPVILLVSQPRPAPVPARPDAPS
ncbi:MAG TPA: hypothetical protein VGM90_23760 [Kofleriaceae bacterium]